MLVSDVNAAAVTPFKSMLLLSSPPITTIDTTLEAGTGPTLVKGVNAPPAGADSTSKVPVALLTRMLSLPSDWMNNSPFVGMNNALTDNICRVSRLSAPTRRACLFREAPLHFHAFNHAEKFMIALLGVGFQISDFRFQISNFKFQISDFKFEISN